jgi:hypothetical protein
MKHMVLLAASLGLACASSASRPPTSIPDGAPPVTPPAAEPDVGAPAPGPAADAQAARDTGSAPAPDATPGNASDASTSPPDEQSFACTLLIGINATEEWYKQGFEKLVDDARWEIVRVHSGFVELWANPNDGVWSTAPSSPCAQNPTKPDRVIFVALNFDYTTLAQWLPPLQATVKNLQAKYPTARRIELATFVRAPGNKPCPQAPAKRSTIAPAEDQAIEMVAATNPQLIKISPKFEAKSCSEFSGNPPHPTAAGGAAWAAMMAAYYK